MLTPLEDRERLVQLAFEGLGATGVFVADQAVLSLYAAGRTSGLVVEYGLDKVDVTAVLDGQQAPIGAARVPVGGRQLTEHVRALAAQRGLALDEAVAEELKRACLGFPAFQAAPVARPGADGGAGAEAEAARTVFALPDGQEIELKPFQEAASGALLEPALLAAYAGPARAAHPLATAPLPDLIASLGLSLQDRESRKVPCRILYERGGDSLLSKMKQKRHHVHWICRMTC